MLILIVLTLAVLGQVPESEAGWLTCPPRWLVAPARQPSESGPTPLWPMWDSLVDDWERPLVRSLVLIGLWYLSGRRGPPVLVWWPWWLWLWERAAVAWPGVRPQPGWRAGHWLLWHGYQVLLCGMAVEPFRPQVGPGAKTLSLWPLGLGCLGAARSEPAVEVRRLAAGGYQVHLRGEFTLQVSGDDPFRERMLIVFLRALDSPGQHRGSRRTREGRTPVVRQQQVAAWFGLTQPEVSRYEDYWRRGAWPELHSQTTPEILTTEVVHRIVQVCVTCPHWNAEQVQEYLDGQGLAVTGRQVRQALEQSGWLALRQELQRRYHWTADAFQPRDEWLVQDLLGHIHQLTECLEVGRALPAEVRLALTDLQTGLREAQVAPRPPVPALPWLARVERVVFGQWEMLPADTIGCPACGSTQVARKSRTPRLKKFYDAQGQVQAVPVYRYYCGNPDCRQGSFTHLPPGLVPYSRHRLEVHLLALQAYAWGYGTYRRVGQALLISEITVYRWVSAWGDDLLPVAALLGVVRSSGVVGVDEKYVLVPKNNKPQAPRRRWMYVYLAVDVHTYDLLHIALYPHNTRESAQAFLLALRAKGYHPQVIVTDLRRDYGAVIPQVFPAAQHHECLFHAEQAVGHYLRDTLGRDYAHQQPVAAQLRAEVVHLFEVRTQPAVQQRYQALRARQPEYVAQLPQLQWVFDFLEHHWPCLINGIESDLIPATNNAVEMVIRRFDQHYQNFCGFDSAETAQVYLGVFEKIYRFTPFSNDARPAIRGKSPLQLAGYDVSHMPMPWLCSGWSLEWPLTAEAPRVPNL